MKKKRIQQLKAEIALVRELKENAIQNKIQKLREKYVNELDNNSRFGDDDDTDSDRSESNLGRMPGSEIASNFAEIRFFGNRDNRVGAVARKLMAIEQMES